MLTEKESRIKTSNALAARAIFTRIAISRKMLDNCLDMKTFSSYRNIDIRIHEYSCTDVSKTFDACGSHMNHYCRISHHLFNGINNYLRRSGFQVEGIDQNYQK